MMKSINLKDLDLSSEESRDIIEFLARKRNVSNYEHMTNKELLSTLKEKPYLPQKPLKLGKCKNIQILTTQPPRKVAKLEINQNLTLHRPIKIAKRRKTQNLTPQKSLKLGKRKNNQILTTQPTRKVAKLEINQNLTPNRPIKASKRRKTQNLTPQKQDKSKNNQQQIISKNKERIEIIREQLRELAYKLSKSELKEIKKRLYKVENKKGLLG